MARYNKQTKMADSSESESAVTENEELKQELDDLKRDLDGWREAFLPIRRVLLWERSYYPVIIFGITTLVFALIWIIEPTVLTTFAVLGLVIISIDFTLPFFSQFIFSSTQWTATEEQEFEELCLKILHLRTHAWNFVQGMSILKRERPRLYFCIVMGILAVFAWIGQLMNNLFLSYYIVLTSLMIPGLRHTGLMQRYLFQYWNKLKQMIFGRQEISKRKTE